MATLIASFVQLDDAALALRASWLQLQSSLGVTMSASWLQLQAAPIVAVPADPASVLASATSDTAGTITWASVSHDESSFDVQLETPTGSGNWVAATGDTNPTGAGVVSFSFTGQVSGALLTPRVRGNNGAGSSGWTVGSPFGLDNVGGGGGIIPGPLFLLASWLQFQELAVGATVTASITAVEPSRDHAVLTYSSQANHTGQIAAREALTDRAAIAYFSSLTQFEEIAAREVSMDRARIVASVASSRVAGGMLASLAAEFTLSRSQVGLFIDYAQVLDCAIRATRFYAGWATLDDPTSNRGVFTITGSTTVLPDEWAIIFPLFVLYVERETAIAIESSRVAGVDAVGRDSASVEGDIRQLEEVLPQKAYVEPAWSVGFPSTVL